MGLLNPQGYFDLYGASSAGGAGPNTLIPQTKIPQTKIPNDLGNEVAVRDIILSAARISQDTRAVLEIADDNNGSPGTWKERASIRTADYGNAMRSHFSPIKIKQNQWYRVRSYQTTVGAHEVQLVGDTAVSDIVASYLNGTIVT